MTDAELIRYCEVHSQTEVGLIHRDMLKRLMQLAGIDAPWIDGREFWSLDLDEACKLARQRASTTVLLQDPS